MTVELSFLVEGESYKVTLAPVLELNMSAQASMAREKTWTEEERREQVTIRLFERDKSIILRSLTVDNKQTELRSYL